MLVGNDNNMNWQVNSKKCADQFWSVCSFCNLFVELLTIIWTKYHYSTELIQTKASTHWWGFIYCSFDVQIFFYYCFALHLIVPLFFWEETYWECTNHFYFCFHVNPIPALLCYFCVINTNALYLCVSSDIRCQFNLLWECSVVDIVWF